MTEPQRFHRWVAVVLGLALFVRLAVLASLWSAWDWHVGMIPDAWDQLAINLVDNHTFGFSPHEPTVARGPVFPLVEIPLYLIFGTAYAGWSISLLLLDTLTCLLLVLTGKKLWGNRTALLAGLFYAVNLPIVFYAAKISQVTSVLPLVIMWLYWFSLWDESYNGKRYPILLGIVSGLMILNKTVYLPVPFICVGLLLWTKRRESRTAINVLPVVLYLIVTLAVVAPWTIRNYRVTDCRIVPVQSMFWELFTQDILYDDLESVSGSTRAEGELLDYFLAREGAIVVES